MIRCHGLKRPCVVASLVFAGCVVACVAWISVTGRLSLLPLATYRGDATIAFVAPSPDGRFVTAGTTSGSLVTFNGESLTASQVAGLIPVQESDCGCPLNDGVATSDFMFVSCHKGIARIVGGGVEFLPLQSQVLARGGDLSVNGPMQYIAVGLSFPAGLSFVDGISIFSMNDNKRLLDIDDECLPVFNSAGTHFASARQPSTLIGSDGEFMMRRVTDWSVSHAIDVDGGVRCIRPLLLSDDFLFGTNRGVVTRVSSELSVQSIRVSTLPLTSVAGWGPLSVAIDQRRRCVLVNWNEGTYELIAVLPSLATCSYMNHERIWVGDWGGHVSVINVPYNPVNAK